MLLIHRFIEDLMESDRRVNKEIKKKRAKILFCHFEKCRKYNKIDRNSIDINLCQCKTCKRNFYKKRDTLLFYVKLTQKRFYQVMRCIIEGNGTRVTWRIFGCAKDMVTKVIKRFGNHFNAVSKIMIDKYHIEDCQLD